MALGKLSASLAHELNYPADAVQSGIVSLRNHLQLLPESFKNFVKINLDRAILNKVNTKIKAILARDKEFPTGAGQRNNLKAALLKWMDIRNMDCLPEVAGNLADYGFTSTDADELELIIDQRFLPAALNWINTTLITERMLTGIGNSSNDIGRLVGSVKNFTHMDRSNAKQYADIHDGICNTIIMMRHKISRGNVVIKQNFDDRIPPVKSMIGELNQVWTNLIDNALDAMEGNPGGLLEIKTSRVQDNVVVSLIDNGPGIPEDIQGLIFDQFFTTKQIGKGTGLGLDLVSRIILQHCGTIQFNSVPGKTEFTVSFPINS